MFQHEWKVRILFLDRNYLESGHLAERPGVLFLRLWPGEDAGLPAARAGFGVGRPASAGAGGPWPVPEVNRSRQLTGFSGPYASGKSVFPTNVFDN